MLPSPTMPIDNDIDEVLRFRDPVPDTSGIRVGLIVDSSPAEWVTAAIKKMLNNGIRFSAIFAVVAQNSTVTSSFFYRAYEQVCNFRAVPFATGDFSHDISTLELGPSG